MRVALFGGTFDPIHRGHLALAAAAADAFALNRVLFAPTGRQPLKPEATAASFADRLTMVELAIAEDSPAAHTFAASSLDAPHPDGSANYTVDLLTTLRQQLPGDQIFVLTGADSFLELRRWRAPDQLLTLAEWIVVSRPGSPLSEIQLASLALTPAQRAHIHLLTTLHEDVSATDLRLRLQAGEDCTGLIPRAVATYIRAHHLYK